MFWQILKQLFPSVSVPSEKYSPPPQGMIVNYSLKWRWISWAFTDPEVNNNVSIYPRSESVRNRPFKKNQIIKKQSRALSRSLISEYPRYSLISEPITAREKYYSRVGYMLMVDIYFLWSNKNAQKVLSTCLVITKSISIYQTSE